MINSAFDLGQIISLKTIEYKLHQDLWTRHDLTAIDLNFNNWNKIKYLNDDASDFHPDVNTIPNNSGGLYLFFLKCPVIIGMTEFPFYIGRAQLTEHQNLRKRCREYFTKYARSQERPKITRMIRYWGPELHLAYKIIQENEAIRDFEKSLINSLLLPMNDEIPDQEIRQAIQAF